MHSIDTCMNSTQRICRGMKKLINITYVEIVIWLMHSYSLANFNQITKVLRTNSHIKATLFFIFYVYFYLVWKSI